MVLKRKRSESEFSFASSSTFSSPQRPFESRLMMDLDFSAMPTTPSSRGAVPAYLPSRTMKRFRDSRPPADIIHQRTLDILYSAAAQKSQHEPTLQPLEDQSETTIHSNSSSRREAQQQQQQQQQQQTQQTSLHSFWKLPPTTPGMAAAVNSQPPATTAIPSVYAPTSCEDCGRALAASGAAGMDDGDDDAMMDVDEDGADEGGDRGCGACGKHVCSRCSITKLGERRRCLRCAGSSSGGGAGKLGLRGGRGWWPAATIYAR